MPGRFRSWLQRLASLVKRFLVYLNETLETNPYLMFGDEPRGDALGRFWALRTLSQLESGFVTERRVETALLISSYLDPWLRYRAITALTSAFLQWPELVTERRLSLLIPRLIDLDPSVRFAALRACETVWLLAPWVFTDRILTTICRLASKGMPQPKTLLLSCLPHPVVEAAIANDPVFGQAGLDMGCIAVTNRLFREDDLTGLSIGGQALVKVLIYSSAKLGTEPEAIRDRLHQVILPAIRVIEHLSNELPTIGMEIHRLVRTDDPADYLLASSQAMLANYLNFIQLSHELGESHLFRYRRAAQLEMRTMPACYPIFKLIIDSFVDVGLLPDGKQHFYLSTIQGDLRNEIISLLVSTFFLDLPCDRGPQVLKGWTTRERDAVSFPGCYTYVGVTLDPHTGNISGSQSNIINKVLAHNIQLVDELGEKLQTIPTYLYKRDLARKALLAAAALAYLRPHSERSALEDSLASRYADLRERLADFYLHELDLMPGQAKQLLGEPYHGSYGPPHGVDKDYIHSSVELLRERLLDRSGKVEALTDILDEAAQQVKALVYGPDFAPIVDAFYLGQLKEVVPAMVTMLYSTDAGRQVRAARLLGIAGGAQARQALEANLSTRDRDLRIAVVESLDNIADPNSLPPLESLLRREDDSGVKATVETVIASLTAKQRRWVAAQSTAVDDG